jgi:DNA-binding XRE family transcriptional regulator
MTPRRSSVQTYARIGGILFLVSIVAGGFGEGFAPSQLVVTFGCRSYAVAVATRIRELRLRRAEQVPTAFTVTALARRLGVSEVSLRSWERGANRPTHRHARALARELGVQVADLGLDDEPRPAADNHNEAKRTS